MADKEIKHYQAQLFQACRQDKRAQAKKALAALKKLAPPGENPHIQLFLGDMFTTAVAFHYFEIAGLIVENGLDPALLKYAIYSLVISAAELAQSGAKGILAEDPSAKIEFLTNQHSEINYLDDQGRTPLDIAYACGYSIAAEALRRFGAKEGVEIHSADFQALRPAPLPAIPAPSPKTASPSSQTATPSSDQQPTAEEKAHPPSPLNFRQRLLVVFRAPLLDWMPDGPRWLALKLELIEALLQSRKIPPGNFDVLLFQAHGYLGLNRPQQALEALDGLIAHQNLQTSGKAAWAYFNRSRLHRSFKHNMPNALEDVFQAHRLMDQASCSEFDRYKIRLTLAWCQFCQKEYANSIATLTDLLQQNLEGQTENPTELRASLYGLRACAHYHLRNYTESLADIERSNGLEAESKHLTHLKTSELFYTFAGIRLHFNDLQGALQDLEMALKLEPGLRFKAKRDQELALLRKLPEVMHWLNEP